MRTLDSGAKRSARRQLGFSVVEVIVAGSIMIVLCVGVLSVTAYVVQRNRGESLRMQALSVLQQEAEHVRSLRFVPVGSSAELNEGTYENIRSRTSADGRVFDISVTVTNLPSGTPDTDAKFKEITIAAVPRIAETGWMANLRTTLTLQRVRSN